MNASESRSSQQFSVLAAPTTIAVATSVARIVTIGTSPGASQSPPSVVMITISVMRGLVSATRSRNVAVKLAFMGARLGFWGKDAGS